MIDDPRLPPRFWAKVSPEPMSGCWLWTGAGNGTGYGAFRMANPERLLLAHRVSYEALAGPIPSDLEMDHLCRTRCCVNPEHLEPVTRAENMRRGLIYERRQRAVDARSCCVNGHAYDASSFYTWPSRGLTWRRCRVCDADRQRARYAANKHRRSA